MRRKVHSKVTTNQNSANQFETPVINNFCIIHLNVSLESTVNGERVHPLKSSNPIEVANQLEKCSSYCKLQKLQKHIAILHIVLCDITSLQDYYRRRVVFIF